MPHARLIPPALLTLAGVVVFAACGNNGQSIATPAQSSTNGVSVDCGSADTVPSEDDLKAALVTSEDLRGDFGTMEGEPSPALFEDFGDDFFKRTVDESRFSGGFISLFVGGDILEGGDGRIVTSIVMTFEDEEAAATLINHPFLGDPDVQRSVTTLEFGDEHDAIYYEVSNGVTFVGHILQFRVGRTVAYIGDVVAGGDASVGEAERLGVLMCRRLRAP